MHLWQYRVMIGMGVGVGVEGFSSGMELLGLSSWNCVLGGEGGRGCLCGCGEHDFGRCRQICHGASFSSIGTRERMERENKSWRKLGMV